VVTVREDVDTLDGPELDAEAERIAHMLLGDAEMQFPRASVTPPGKTRP
jgi:hypothetical protein